MSSVLVKSVDLARIRAAVDEYARRLLDTDPEVQEIVVFGSFAKGNYAPGSDVDLLIVLSHSDLPFRDRIPRFLPGRFPAGLDLFPCTREEIASPASAGFMKEVQASSWRYSRAVA